MSETTNEPTDVPAEDTATDETEAATFAGGTEPLTVADEATFPVHQDADPVSPVPTGSGDGDSVPAVTGNGDASDSVTESGKDVFGVSHPASADDSVLVQEIHGMVSEIHAQIQSLIPILEKVGPTVDLIAEEVKAKGILGLLPHLMAAFKG